MPWERLCDSRGRGVKPMFRPDDEDKPFIRRWNQLARILLVESTVKLVARAAMDFADFDDGSNCFPSTERMVRETGLSDRSVRNGWAVLRGLGMAERESYGNSFHGAAAVYQLQIPDNWASMPTYGPHMRKFACLGCGKAFTPDAHSLLSDRSKDKTKPNGVARKVAGDSVAWIIGKFTFCSWPSESGKTGNTKCLDAWNTQRRRGGEKPWNQVEAKWDFFYKARNDPW